MPNSVIKKVTDWGRKSLKAQSTKTLKFLNRTKEAYTWEKDEFNKDEDLVEEETIHPDLAANMPGIQLEEDLIEPTTAVQDEDLSDAEIAHAAAVNGGLLETPTQTTGVYNADYDVADVATTADKRQENTKDTDPCFKEELQPDTKQLLEEDNDDSSVVRCQTSSTKAKTATAIATVMTRVMQIMTTTVPEQDDILLGYVTNLCS